MKSSLCRKEHRSDMLGRYPQWFLKIDQKIRAWMGRLGVPLLRISLGLIFFWFGFLKFFPDLSPAESLAKNTIETLTLGKINPAYGIKLLAAWECLVGVGLITGKFLRTVLLLLAFQMVGAMSPIFIFPEKVFISTPFVPSLEGQYIFKNLILISSAIVIGSGVEKPDIN